MATVATSSLVAVPTASGSRAIELLLLLLQLTGNLFDFLSRQRGVQQTARRCAQTDE
jgi:hypothetical protein